MNLKELFWIRVVEQNICSLDKIEWPKCLRWHLSREEISDLQICWVSSPRRSNKAVLDVVGFHTPPSPHHAEGLVNPKVREPANGYYFWYPRYSENINLKIGHGSYLFQLFLKRDFYFIKCGWTWQKMTKWFFNFFRISLIFDYIRCKNVWDVFHDLKNVKIEVWKSVHFDQFWPILTIFYEFKSRFEKSW
jgi:hypothetical protein